MSAADSADSDEDGITGECDLFDLMDSCDAAEEKDRVSCKERGSLDVLQDERGVIMRDIKNSHDFLEKCRAKRPAILRFPSRWKCAESWCRDDVEEGSFVDSFGDVEVDQFIVCLIFF